MVASSTNMTGMLSLIGYTLRHSPHLRLFPLSLTSSGFLQTGHTRISKSSLSIIREILRLQDSVEKVNGTSRTSENLNFENAKFGLKGPGFDSAINLEIKNCPSGLR